MKDSITLIVESTGDSSVGIERERIEIKMWKGYIRPDTKLREEIKKLFIEPCAALFETHVESVKFSDEINKI
jgi:hypothetical protein